MTLTEENDVLIRYHVFTDNASISAFTPFPNKIGRGGGCCVSTDVRPAICLFVFSSPEHISETHGEISFIKYTHTHPLWSIDVPLEGYLSARVW